MAFFDKDQATFERAMKLIDRADSIRQANPWVYLTNGHYASAARELIILREKYPDVMREVDETVFCINHDC
jgi:hypothetical protein